jgi:hypothetical protein
MNPLRLSAYRPRGGALGWLDSLGSGRIPASPPTAAAVAATGLEWVLWDPGRCSHRTNPTACSTDTQAAIEAVLGDGQTQADGLVVWQVQPKNDASRP